MYSLHNSFNYYNINDHCYTDYLFLAIHTLIDSVIKTSATPKASHTHTHTNRLIYIYIYIHYIIKFIYVFSNYTHIHTYNGPCSYFRTQGSGLPGRGWRGRQKWLFIYTQRKSQVFALTQNPTTGRFVFDTKLHTSVPNSHGPFPSAITKNRYTYNEMKNKIYRYDSRLIPKNVCLTVIFFFFLIFNISL